jgi:enoyl-CoA hydratase
MSEAMNLARRLANGPPLAIRWTKMSINKRIKADIDFLFDTSMAWEQHTFYTEDHREAVKAFIEKREPQFRGQ